MMMPYTNKDNIIVGYKVAVVDNQLVIILLINKVYNIDVIE